jgi:hypothetical protein
VADAEGLARQRADAASQLQVQLFPGEAEQCLAIDLLGQPDGGDGI